MSETFVIGGKKVSLGPLLGKGGEGAVYNAAGNPDIAVKIYNDGKAPERREKIMAMVSAGLSRTSDHVAFPLEVVNRQNGKFAGFTMKKVAGFKTVHDLYGPGSRRVEFPTADVRFLVRAAYNLSSAIASIHRSGCVVGDINHSGILVSTQALVTLIDSDSFQFRNGGQTFRSLVGVAEYTPAELQGVSFEKTDRTANHDAFGLAVLLFQLLFLGRHPYAGRYLGGGDMDIKTAIAQRRFAYSDRRTETQMEPPPHVTALNDYGDEVKNAFERAFSRSTETGGRPSAVDWVGIIDRLQSNLITCEIDRSHHYHKFKGRCPWCKLEAGIGRSLFTAQLVTPTPSSMANIGQVIAHIGRMNSPPPPPNAENIMPPVRDLKVSAAARSKRSSRGINMTGALIAAAVGAFVTFAVQPVIGLVLAIGALIYFFNVKNEINPFAAELKLSTAAWHQQRALWEKHAGPEHFDERKAHFLKLAANHGALPQRERERLEELDRKKRDLQMRKHMESHLLDRAKVPSIGPGRKATLASYGIETAWDAKSRRITNIPGFGPAMQEKLRAWSKSVEYKFVFNANIPTDPQAIRDVKTDIAKQRAELERDLLKAPGELQRIFDDAAKLRATPPAGLVEAHRRMKQAELDSGRTI
ncbi:DNA-binding helix-hairpin-helix protein with protein kinase domain [Rhizobium azooxidifex]|uniref:DNA-binding helix-hairpin-helix protein with protein kinase domain n=1 Tax=Mycoplana azooxidifex TaxID=1636188 RepID=A0A7W6GK13_9HYPH|nr:DNA-binding helix-hairpin-helix protein with protein kinase domain [Mycoplana azooxidifex]